MTITYDLKGVHAVVTGSSKGIGLATAQLLARSGARALVHGSTQATTDEAVAAVPGSVGVACDLADAAAREGFCDRAEQFCAGRLHMLIHNAGIYPQGTLETQPLDEWQKVQAINVESQFHITKRLRGCLVAAAEAAGDAAVIFVSSAVVRMGRGDSPAYTTSKAAQIGLTRHLASELGAQRVRVNCVLPGQVDTPGARQFGRDTQGFVDFANQRQMLPVPIQSEHLAHTIVFMASPAARAITAASLDVNGGLAVGG